MIFTTSLLKGLEDPEISFDGAVKTTAEFVAEATVLMGTVKTKTGRN